MLYQNFSIKLAVFVVMVAVTLFVLPLGAWADGARVYFKPVDSAEGTMSIDVVADNVANLYGMEFQLKYDPTVLAIQDVALDQEGVQVQPGELLPVKQGFVVSNKADEANGTVVLATTLLNPAPAVSGNGVLAHLTFKVLSDQASTLEIQNLNMVSADMQPIAYQKENLNFGNSNSLLIWVILGSAGLVMAVLALGGGYFLVMKPKPTPKRRDIPQPQIAKVAVNITPRSRA